MSAQDEDSNAPLLGGDPALEYGGIAGTSSSKAHNSSFRQNLGTAEAFSIIISIVIGSGIFTSPGAIDTNVPSPGAALVVWFVGGILAWTGAATMAELGTAIPGEGPYRSRCPRLPNGSLFSPQEVFNRTFSTSMVRCLASLPPGHGSSRWCRHH